MNAFARILPLCIALLTTPAAPAAERPNFVFIYADDLGWGDLACHGHPHILTPHIDRLAKEGTDFQQFAVLNPVCSPSRTAIITGQFPSRHGVHQHFSSHKANVERGMPDWLDPKAPLLPKILKAAGYRTAHYGKWHLTSAGITDAPLPADYGYDHAAVWTSNAPHVFEGTRYADMENVASAHDQKAASFLSVAATDHTLKFIRKSKDQPFYVNLWLHETHHLVSATEEDKKPYPDTAEPHRTYYAAVTRADRQVGRVLALLDELKLADNTLVIFSSDNGPENTHENAGQKLYFSRGETGGLRGRKRSLLMGGVNVPFIVRWPGKVPAGRVDKITPLAGVDVFPTFLAATNIPLPDDYQSDGENVIGALSGKPLQRSKPLFWFWQGSSGGDDWPRLAMRDGPWMLAMDDEAGRRELYNVVADRGQEKDLADSEPERLSTMVAATRKWKATLPTKIDPALQTKEQPGKTKAAAKPKTRAEIFIRKDADKDGKLTLEEYLDRFPDPEEGKRRFPTFDTDGDGMLTPQEFRVESEAKP